MEELELRLISKQFCILFDEHNEIISILEDESINDSLKIRKISNLIQNNSVKYNTVEELIREI